MDNQCYRIVNDNHLCICHLICSPIYFTCIKYKKKLDGWEILFVAPRLQMTSGSLPHHHWIVIYHNDGIQMPFAPSPIHHHFCGIPTINVMGGLL